MQYVLIIHEVEDYDAWKKIFDDAASIKKDAAEQSYQVLKYELDPNKIVHFTNRSSISSAREFLESPELVKIREQAGVKAPEALNTIDVCSASDVLLAITDVDQAIVTPPAIRIDDAVQGTRPRIMPWSVDFLQSGRIQAECKQPDNMPKLAVTDSCTDCIPVFLCDGSSLASFH